MESIALWSVIWFAWLFYFFRWNVLQVFRVFEPLKYFAIGYYMTFHIIASRNWEDDGSEWGIGAHGSFSEKCAALGGFAAGLTIIGITILLGYLTATTIPGNILWDHLTKWIVGV